MNINSDDILKKIESDICEKGYMYFLPDNPNSEYIGSRCHLYFDKNEWLICFETITYAIGAQGVYSELLYFSSKDSVSNSNPLNIKYVFLSDCDNLKSLFGDKLSSDLKDTNLNLIHNGKSILIENRQVISNYFKIKVPQYRFHEISPSEVMRFLIDTIPDSIFLSEEQLKYTLGTTLNKKMQINEWKHEAVICEDKDNCNLRENEFLKNIQQVIEKRSIDVFVKELNPNTNWINYMYGL